MQFLKFQHKNYRLALLQRMKLLRILILLSVRLMKIGKMNKKGFNSLVFLNNLIILMMKG